MTRTQENTGFDRPVYLVADAVNLPASGALSYQVPCEGYSWAYIEVNCSTAITLYGAGNSGYGSSTFYYNVNETGTLASRAVSANAPYSMRVRCTGLATVGCQVTNTDGANAGTLTVRIALANV